MGSHYVGLGLGGTFELVSESILGNQLLLFFEYLRIDSLHFLLLQILPQIFGLHAPINHHTIFHRLSSQCRRCRRKHRETAGSSGQVLELSIGCGLFGQGIGTEGWVGDGIGLGVGVVDCFGGVGGLFGVGMFQFSVGQSEVDLIFEKLLEPLLLLPKLLHLIYIIHNLLSFLGQPMHSTQIILAPNKLNILVSIPSINHLHLTQPMIRIDINVYKFIIAYNLFG